MSYLTLCQDTKLLLKQLSVPLLQEQASRKEWLLPLIDSMDLLVNFASDEDLSCLAELASARGASEDTSSIQQLILRYHKVTPGHVAAVQFQLYDLDHDDSVTNDCGCKCHREPSSQTESLIKSLGLIVPNIILCPITEV